MVAKQAVVLVGGKGSRLGEITRLTPKPLLKIDGNRCFLDYLLFEIARHGFSEILLLAGHLHEQFEARYHGTRLMAASLRVLTEPSNAGTAGCLRHAAGELSDVFLLMNGDTFLDVNLRSLESSLTRNETALGVLALRRVDNVARFGSVELDKDMIVGFKEKSKGSGGKTGLINGGVGIFRKRILDVIGPHGHSLEAEVYPRLALRRELAAQEVSGYFIDIGVPETLAKARADLPKMRRRPTLFLDRDGVLNRDRGYTYLPKDLEWIPGAVETVRAANDAGCLVVVVTNQAGVAKGLFTEQEVQRFHDEMSHQLALAGAHIDAFYFCPFHADAVFDIFRSIDHPDRKPQPGMINKAIADLPIDPNLSVLVGDQPHDIEAARRAGIKALLFSGSSLFDIGEAALKLCCTGRLDAALSC